jgi:hypothetical protein
MAAPPPVSVNWLALLASCIAAYAIGFIWYGPLFGKAWMKLSGITPKMVAAAKKKGVAKTYVLGFLHLAVMAYVLVHIVRYAQAATFSEGMIAGLWSWLGFLATTQLGSVLWDGKPFRLYVLNTLHYAVSLAVMGGILAAWP